MSAKIITVLCAQALFAQVAFSQCIGRGAIAAPGLIGTGLAAPFGLAGAYGLAAPALGLAAPGLATPCGWAAPALDITPTSGGGLPVSSGSAAAPVGISVASENVYEGILAATGELPFVGTVGLEGVLPTAGAGVVNHSCGNGINAAVAPAAAAVAPFGAIAPGLAAPGLGLAAPGLGLAAPGLGLAAPGLGLAAPGLGLAAPALGYAGWAGRGYGYAI